jgi:transcriptional regulator with XRE-family HTH domain
MSIVTPGQLLRDARRRHHVTQKQLAARARTSQAAISRIERDEISPTVETLRNLLDLLGEELTLNAQPIDYGHDVTLNQEALDRTPSKRIAFNVSFAKFARKLREARVGPDFDPRRILEALVRHGVDFVLIGGLAGVALGSAYQTSDMDIAYERSQENLEHLVSALGELGAAARGAPKLDATSIAPAKLTFDTPHGRLDIVAKPSGSPPYEKLRDAADRLEIDGFVVTVASVDHLIAMKEAAGRNRDKLMATEYRVLADEIRRREAEAR